MMETIHWEMTFRGLLSMLNSAIDDAESNVNCVRDARAKLSDVL